MKKYLYIIKTTFNDSLQYLNNLLFRFIGFTITLYVLISLWTFIYSDGTSIIEGYSFKQMIWYLLLSESIVFGSGSSVARYEVQESIKEGNVAYQINKPYNYIIYIICKYIADTLLRFITILIIAICLGLIFAGAIPNFNIISIIYGLPVFIISIIITGMIRILISLLSFWIEDSQPFQNIYNKIILIFGVFFPIEMFPKLIGNILKYTPIYSITYGPSKLILNFNTSLFRNILMSQIITIIIISILLSITYRKGVRKLNVNGG